MARSTVSSYTIKKNKNETPEFAGDYVLEKLILINHLGYKVDIKYLMTELNIYESIYKNALTGSVVVADEGNQIARMSIQGLERIAFHLKTPGVAYGKEDVVDATEETGEPFQIFNVTDRKQVNQGLTIYTLHFASREFMRNLRTKVSQAYDGKYDRAVIDIMKDKDYLDSRKKLHYEPTGNSNKIVIPNLQPFAAINMIAKKSIADKTNGVGYYFYETTGGYYFRSWASMITSQGNFSRPAKQSFYYQPAKMASENRTKNKDNEIQDQVEKEYQSVESYEFVNNFHDIATNTALGTYGHRVISHNLFDKSYDIADYNFHSEYQTTPHADSVGKFANNRYPVSNSPVDYDNRDSVSDYAESRVSLQVTTPFVHDKDVGKYGLDAQQDGLKTGHGISQENQVKQGTVLKLVVKGQSYLQAGDLIEFDLRDVNKDDPQNNSDPRFSGNYIITKIRHHVTGEKYDMVLECVKDSVATAYGEQGEGYNGADAGFAMNIHKASKSELQLEEIDGDIYT